jgi:SAM-dependent methyltransferase
MTKPYAPSCDSNRESILAVIRPLFSACHSVLEIGSGTGQHAVYFAEKMPHLTWHTSDRAENHPGIRLWLAEAGLSNLREPVLLDVTQSQWPEPSIDAVFSANTAHIMPWESVQKMFKRVGEQLPAGGRFALYGPFNYGGHYSSDSNARFDDWLKSRDPLSGIRHFEGLNQLASLAQLDLQGDYEMPANNRVLCWEKRAKKQKLLVPT